MSIATRTPDNGVDSAALIGARNALAEQPEAARFEWRATCDWVHGTHSASTVEGFYGLGEEQRDAPLATADEVEAFHIYLEDLMRRTGFLNPDHPRQLKLRLRRIFNRAQLDQTEVNILRGLFAAADADKRERKAKS